MNPIFYRLVMTLYTLSDYSNISENGFDYKIEQSILDTIKKIATVLGINTSATILTTTNNDTKYKRGADIAKNFGAVSFKRGKSNPDFATDESWERLRSFKTTKIEKKEGIDKIINDVRICLNKLSESNYEKQQDDIFQFINKILENEEETMTENRRDDDLLKVANALFDIASNNKFYSELYAILYKELANRFPIFKEIIISYVSNYLENVGKIQFIDPNKEYDKYCDNNKENDKRKAVSVFLVNLMKMDLIQKDEILNIILMLQETVISYIDQDNKSYEVEEITENMYVFISTCLMQINKIKGSEKGKKICTTFELLIGDINYDSKDMVKLEKWMAIIDNVEKCSKLKVKDHLSISNRTVFRYMDLLDIINKK